jgi:hypothetical protein
MNIALVQLGNRPKAYFWKNLDHIRKLHDSDRIYVISDLQEVITKAQKRGFKGHLYKTPASLDELFSKHAFSKKFRNGFWQLSALRLFALLDFCLNSDDESVLHIESDVLVMPNFPFVEISRQNNLMWFNFNHDRDIASLIWVPSQKQASWMHQELLKIFSENPKMTDMSALRNLSVKANDKICYFPSRPGTTSVGDSETNTDVIEKQTLRIPNQNGIFDGAAIGMWLTGEDPNNHRGMLRRLRHLSDGPIDLRGRKFAVMNKNLYLVEQDSFLPIHNLHIHSKNRYLFTGKGIHILRFLVLLSNKKISLPIFMPLSFLFLGLNKMKNIWK